VPAWRTAKVVAVRDETPRTKTFRLALDGPSGHQAGQHFVVRLTAPDGYTASRSYSVASPPDDGNEIEFTVERLDDGEVSTFLHDVVELGDDLEVRGPIGGYFVWHGTSPALLLGGGSGVVPLMAMLRLARATNRDHLAHLVVSARTPDDLYYSDELIGHDDVTVVFTRATPTGWPRPPARVRADDVVPLLRDELEIFVCGSAPFTGAVGDLLLDLGVMSERVRFERFGPSG
jgi:ferredoxin-NADP reductase